jgi:hypothetical protein
MASASAGKPDYVELSDGTGSIFKTTYTIEDIEHNDTVYKSLELGLKRLDNLVYNIHMEDLEKKNRPKLEILNDQQRDINRARKIGRDIEWYFNYSLDNPSVKNSPEILSEYQASIETINNKNKDLEQHFRDITAKISAEPVLQAIQTGKLPKLKTGTSNIDYIINDSYFYELTNLYKHIYKTFIDGHFNKKESLECIDKLLQITAVNLRIITHESKSTSLTDMDKQKNDKKKETWQRIENLMNLFKTYIKNINDIEDTSSIHIKQLTNTPVTLEDYKITYKNTDKTKAVNAVKAAAAAEAAAIELLAMNLMEKKKKASKVKSKKKEKNEAGKAENNNTAPAKVNITKKNNKNSQANINNTGASARPFSVKGIGSEESEFSNMPVHMVSEVELPHNNSKNNEANTIPAVIGANPHLEQFRNNLNVFDPQAKSNNVSLSKQSYSSIVEHIRSKLFIEKLINLTSAKFQQQFINLYAIAKEKTVKPKFSTTSIDILFKKVNHMFLQATLLTRYVIRNFMKTRLDGKYIFNNVELNKNIVLIDMVNIYKYGESGKQSHKSFKDYEKWLYPKLSKLGTRLNITFICVKPFLHENKTNTLISSQFDNIVIINTDYKLQEIVPVTKANVEEYKGYEKVQKADYVKDAYRYTVDRVFDIEKIIYFAIKPEMLKPAVSAYQFDTSDDLVIAILWIVFYYCDFHVSILSGDNFAWFRINSLYISSNLNKCIKFGINKLESQASYMHRINTFIKLYNTAVESDFELVLSKKTKMDKIDKELIDNTILNIENMPHISDLS